MCQRIHSICQEKQRLRCWVVWGQTKLPTTLKYIFSTLVSCKSDHIVYADLQISPRHPAGRVAFWELRSICHHRPTFHNGSNLYGPVLALSAAGQNTQGIKAEYIPLSDTGSHSTVSFPFRLYAPGNEGFSFSSARLWITYWNPALEQRFKHCLVHFLLRSLWACSYFTSAQEIIGFSFYQKRRKNITEVAVNV